MDQPTDVTTWSSPSITGHGGSCCGISHIYHFQGMNSTVRTPENCEARVRFLISKYWHDSGRTLDRNKNRLYEAVLKESQRKEWEPVLLAVGFELVTDFLNTNSGNRCYVYHYAMGAKNKHGPYKFLDKPVKKGSITNPFKPRPAVAIRY